MFEHLKARYALQDRWRAAKKTPERWQIIRDVYALELPRILEAGREGGAVNPYFLDWDFTPIESLAWMDIRGRGLPLFPQFPVDRVFLDFADPCKKIGVELDGAAYHEHDRDLARDTRLVEQGWKIFRVKGRTAVKIVPNPFDDESELRARGEWREALINWGVSDSSGFFWALREAYYHRKPRELDAAMNILSRYQLARFELMDDGE